jgi:hypothetical protein
VDVFGLELFVSVIGLSVACFTAVLGIWIERDRARPPYTAILLSIMILIALFVELGHAFFEEYRENALQDEMARILEQLEEIAAESGDERLSTMVRQQARANRQLSRKLDRRRGKAKGKGKGAKGKPKSKGKAKAADDAPAADKGAKGKGAKGKGAKGKGAKGKGAKGKGAR